MIGKYSPEDVEVLINGKKVKKPMVLDDSDDAIIKSALESKWKVGGVTFEDLYECRTSVLLKRLQTKNHGEMDLSIADVFLAAHLNLWSKDEDQIIRIMRRSKLAVGRLKYFRSDYLQSVLKQVRIMQCH